MPKRTGKKRKITAVEDMGVSEDVLIDKFLELPADELAKVIVDIAARAKIKISAIQKARTSLPSYSIANLEWPDFAEKFGLRDCLENNKFEQVVTPVYNLPPSVHEIMFEAAWRTEDVYGDRQVQSRAAARSRLLDLVRQRLTK
jgi:hypothetical protein